MSDQQLPTPSIPPPPPAENIPLSTAIYSPEDEILWYLGTIQSMYFGYTGDGYLGFSGRGIHIYCRCWPQSWSIIANILLPILMVIFCFTPLPFITRLGLVGVILLLRWLLNPWIYRFAKEKQLTFTRVKIPATLFRRRRIIFMVPNNHDRFYSVEFIAVSVQEADLIAQHLHGYIMT
ncbi:MAG: hypothetical protein ACYDCO_21860 [Armatimonadota bacterium]